MVPTLDMGGIWGVSSRNSIDFRVPDVKRVLGTLLKSIVGQSGAILRIIMVPA